MRWSAIPVVFLVALSVRLLHLWLMRDSPYLTVLMGDARAYDEWAVRIAGGDWLGREVFYQAPLYPYFLATVYGGLAHDLMAVRVVQAVMGAGAVALLAASATRLFSSRVGWIAGLLMAFYAPAIFLGVLIQKAILDVLLISLVVYLVARIDGRGAGHGPWFALGLTLGLLSLSRENALVLIPVALAFAGRRSGAILLLGAALVLMPVALRNHYVGGGFYLTTSQLGPNLYIGNNPRADGTYQALRPGRGDAAFERDDARALAESATGRMLTPAGVSDFWRDRALAYVADDPLDWLALMGRKLRLLFSATELPDTEAQESHAESSAVLRWLQPVGHFGLVVPLAVLGVAAAGARRRPLALLYALSATYAASVLVFFVFARYRYPLVPFVLLFAAVGLSNLGLLVAGSRARRVAIALALLIMVGVAYWPALAADARRAISDTNLGVALQAQDRLTEAAVHYRRAIAIRPDYAPAHNNLGIVLRRQGRPAEAVETYQRALALQGDDANTHANLAAALFDLGRQAEALRHFRRAVDLDPADAAKRYDLANALLQTRNAAAAEAEFRRLTAMAPDAAQAHNRLGVALAAQEKYAEAMVAFRRALQLRPHYPEAAEYLRRAEDAARGR